MEGNNDTRYTDINSLLNNVFKPVSLKEVFDLKLQELQLTPTNVLDILEIQHRTLKGILDGTQRIVDFTNLIKLANFLQLPREQAIKLYLDSLEQNYPTNSVTSPEKIKFIKENFDLAVLKKDGFIDNITDFNEIERKIVARLGLKSIFEYHPPQMDVAFSSGLFKPKNHLTRSFWIKAAEACFEEINNPYDYNRQALIEFFPQIRWHSTNIELGLLNIIKNLFKLGVTVVYQPPLHTLQLRGATFSVDNKPCIVLTNYMGHYPTLWFALIHELFHVLFDWDEIKSNSYHLSDDGNDQLTVMEKEKEANQFAREYLFSKEKMNMVKPYLNDPYYVKEFASNNHVHHSIVYVFNAFDMGAKDRTIWARAKKQMPNIRDCIKHIDIPWEGEKPIEEIFKKRKIEIYN